MAQKWFSPVAAKLAAHRATVSRPLLLAVNGSQGSGKSTLADYLVASLKFEHQLSVVTLSLDDFYYTHSERLQLSRKVHPLLATRGVPGTHDMELLNRTLDALLASPRSPGRSTAVNIPRFDKANDDRLPESGWETISGPLDIIILEGWCLGVRPQSAQQLELPVNDLEKNEDAQGVWRFYVNDKIQSQLLPLYNRVDRWLMLQATSFDCVFRWRLEQEQKLAQSLSHKTSSKTMGEAEIARFIQYYQRLTEQCIKDLPGKVHYLYQLDKGRNILNVEYRDSVSG
ncbi:MAG: zeta toxin family protein [Proteobacteria bacterium]|nr:zeta toxin family protein [Pseudomonadota bacterium]